MSSLQALHGPSEACNHPVEHYCLDGSDVKTVYERPDVANHQERMCGKPRNYRNYRPYGGYSTGGSIPHRPGAHPHSQARRRATDYACPHLSSDRAETQRQMPTPPLGRGTRVARSNRSRTEHARHSAFVRRRRRKPTTNTRLWTSLSGASPLPHSIPTVADAGEQGFIAAGATVNEASDRVERDHLG